jgi:hypothetical protein
MVGSSEQDHHLARRPSLAAGRVQAMKYSFSSSSKAAFATVRLTPHRSASRTAKESSPLRAESPR